MFTSIKNYFKKAREEVLQEYSIQPSRDDTDASGDNLPEVWTGVDLDGTLAFYTRTSSSLEIGEPVPCMLARVKKMLDHGIRVKIFTARAQDPDQLPIIRKWLKDNGLPELEITNIKDYNMQVLYDDRCIQVERNTGRLIVDQ